MERARGLVRFFAWAIALWIGYELLEDTPGRTEFLAGAVVAMLGSIAVVRLYAVSRWKYPAHWAWLVHLRHIPWSMLRDTFVVGTAIVRSIVLRAPLHGDMERLPFDRGEIESPDDAVRRAMVTYGISVSPNTVVCRIDDEGILVHRLCGVTDIRTLDRRWPL